MTKCIHPNLRIHTFKDGQTIRMCPDCDAFKTERATVIAGQGNINRTHKAKYPFPVIDRDEVTELSVQNWLESVAAETLPESETEEKDEPQDELAA